MSTKIFQPLGFNAILLSAVSRIRPRRRPPLGATLFIANLADLSSMPTMGSAGFLLIFAAVNGANVVLVDDTQSKRRLSLIGVGLCLAALASLL